MRYYIYSRCSTEEQRKKGNSHNYQIEGIFSNPKLKDAVHIGTFSDTISGTTFIREDLESMYQLCNINRGHVDKVFVYRWDRFGRNVGEAFQMIKKFLDVGVEVNCLDSSIDFSDDNWPIILGVIFGMAQSESMKISSRTKDGLYQANSQGFFTGSAPVGYHRVSLNSYRSNGNVRTIMKPIPEIADILRKCFHEYIEVDSKALLFEKYGKILKTSRSAFFRIFQKIFYAGYIQLPAYKHYPAKVIKGQHEPIISLETWQQEQEMDTDHPTLGMK